MRGSHLPWLLPRLRRARVRVVERLAARRDVIHHVGERAALHTPPTLAALGVLAEGRRATALIPSQLLLSPLPEEHQPVRRVCGVLGEILPLLRREDGPEGLVDVLPELAAADGRHGQDQDAFAESVHVPEH